MPKGARSPLSSQDTDKRLASIHHAASASRTDPAAGGLPGIVQRARVSPGTMSPAEIVTLQRAIGMRAVGSLFSETFARQRPAGPPSFGPPAVDLTQSRPRVSPGPVLQPDRTMAPTENPRSEDSEDDVAIATLTAGPSAAAAPSEGGKGLDGFAIRAPGKDDEDDRNAPAPTGGKGPGSPAADDDERARYHHEIAAFQSQNPREAIISRQRDVLDAPGAVGVQTDDHSGTLRRKGKGSATKSQGTTGTTSNTPSTPPPQSTPPVLRKKTVQGPTANDRGGYNWVVQWELDKPSPAGGWVVQGVNVAGNVKDKDDKPLQTGWESYVPYWEAWQIRAGQKVTTYAEGGDVLDDTFANPSYAAGSKGEVSETGTPQFYEGLTLPTSFKANGVVPAGILPATKSDPGLTGGSGLIAHEIKAKWDSSKGDNTTTVTTA